MLGMLMKQLYLIIGILLLACCSCSRESIVDDKPTSITKEDALKTLRRFLAETRATDQRIIQSVGLDIPDGRVPSYPPGRSHLRPSESARLSPRSNIKSYKCIVEEYWFNWQSR